MMSFLKWLSFGRKWEFKLETKVQISKHAKYIDVEQEQLHDYKEISWRKPQNCFHVPPGKIKSNVDDTIFPPPAYQKIDPEVGMVATAWHENIKWAAVVVSVKKKSIFVQMDYRTKQREFTLRKDGHYREAGTGQNGPIIFFGIQETNIVERKQWYSERVLDAGPVAGPDVRDYLPDNWRKKFDRSRR